MDKQYTFRRAQSAADAGKLRALFNDVFHPDDVGALAETMFHHLPGMRRDCWFIAEEKKTGRFVSAFALIPWSWEMEGSKLKVAEMGIVGTLEEHRGHGLMRILNAEFDKTLDEEAFDLAVIQGIPGFYQQFGYYYALPLENHINLPLHVIPEGQAPDGYAFHLADDQDIPSLLAEDRDYRTRYAISAVRDEALWRYLLNEGRQTEYGSEFWIMEREQDAESFYCRIPEEGFGTGLIVSEISETITNDALDALFAFCKGRAVARDKPYIRLNLHNESPAGRKAIAMGAKPGRPYAWQIKIPEPGRFLTAIAPVLERRIQTSSFRNFSGCFKLNLFKSSVNLHWTEGRIHSVTVGGAMSDLSFSLPVDLFPAFCLGYRSWQELRYIRPDIGPNSEASALLADALFPPTRSWIHEQY